jgi:WD40 repeat protein/tRNA A-37 threonylcarbamoyl transferase component Bud32
MMRLSFAPAELLLALVALERALIDPRQLVVAFETWSQAEERTMREILVEEGIIDESKLVELEEIVASRLRHREGSLVEGPVSPAPYYLPRGGEVPSEGTELSATVAYVSPVRADKKSGPGDGPERTTAPDGRFRVIRPLAHGGLGELFLALDPELDRQVALKELRAFHAYDPMSQSRFLLEAKVTGRLEHPGIVPVYGLGRYADGRPYYAMRFIEGETLKQAIERFHGSPDPGRDSSARELGFRRLLNSFVDACNAVAYAHSRGVVHRDLKPENIMLGPFGETIVVDWGIAKPLAEVTGENTDNCSPPTDPDDSSLTRPGTMIGTPEYMSPEQAAGDLARVDRASDIYSLGATLYCLLVGHGPFPSGSVVDVLEHVRRGIFPAPRRLRRSIDPTLETICLKAMALEQEMRHATALALAGEIEAWLADVRFRGEQERALDDVKRSLVRLCIERAQNLFGRDKPGDGMLWLSRALAHLPANSPGIEHVIRASLSGWNGAAKLVERTLAHGASVNAVSFSPDGRRLATVSDEKTARLWDMAKGALLSAPIRHETTIRAITFSPDGGLIATASDDGMVRRWDGMTGAAVGRPFRHDAPVTAVRFSPDGSKIATASCAGIACLWEAASGRPIGGTTEFLAGVTAITFHPDGSRLAAAGDDGRVWFVETATATLLDDALPHGEPVSVLSFSPDGRRLLIGRKDGRVRLWDIFTKSTLAELPHRAEVDCACYSPLGRSVVTACPDGTARLWDADTGKPIGEPLAHQGQIECIAFNPDGTTVATGSHDGAVRLWGADTGLPIGPHLNHRGAVHGLAFSPDRRRLATACSDGIARCWRVPAPVAGDVERIDCWVRVVTQLEFDDGDAVRPIDQMTLWELRRRLHELGGAPLK